MSKLRAKRVLLIGWDGADWKMIDPLVEQGLMPNLKRFVDGGVMGNVASLNPMLSPILWTSIATGKTGEKHQILGFAEPDGVTGQIRPVTSSSRKCKAIWNILSDRGLRVGVVNWLASHPAEKVNGFVVSDRFPRATNEPGEPWLPLERSIYPVSLLDDACRLRVHPAQTTPIQVSPFIPNLADYDALKDPKVAELRCLLAECATTHAAVTWLMQEQEWDFLGVYYDAIDRFAHGFMEFHPPKATHLDEAAFDRYKHVMTACYRFHDMMLGRLMQLAGDEAVVILLSDHGFHCDHLRPEGSSKIQDGKPVAWHRRYGILAMHGPGIKQDQRIYGASLLDITPTVLALFGCPVADDMDGNVLTQAFDCADFEINTLPTYESCDKALTVDDEEDPWLARRTIARLVDLGYLQNDTTEGVALDRARNLGQIHASAGRPLLAIEQYEEVLAKNPGDKGARVAIAACRLQQGQLDLAESMVQDVLTDEEDAPMANYYLGIINLQRGKTGIALKHLLLAERANPGWIELQCQIGAAYLRRKWWNKAVQAFQKAIEIDPDSAEAHDGLGVAFRELKRFEDAVYQHMKSIALLHYRPQTHINLGLALAETGQFDWAIRAFEVAIEQNSNHPFPYRCLARIYREAKGDPVKAKEYGHRAQFLAKRRLETKDNGKQTACAVKQTLDP